MILITGASGTVGRAVLQEVRKTGKPFNAMYRHTEDAKKAPPGAPTVRADFADKNSLQQALQGIDTAFVVCSPIPQLLELEGNMIDACKEAGVRHVVLNTALGAGDYPQSFPSWHRKVEDKLSLWAWIHDSAAKRLHAEHRPVPCAQHSRRERSTLRWVVQK
jgi:uncharacterized protein YbjT (DUF2867 family)